MNVSGKRAAELAGKSYPSFLNDLEKGRVRGATFEHGRWTVPTPVRIIGQGGYTTTEVANMVGVSRSTVHMWVTKGIRRGGVHIYLPTREDPLLGRMVSEAALVQFLSKKDAAEKYAQPAYHDTIYDWDSVDWRMNNSEIAKLLGCSRQRVHQKRKKLEKERQNDRQAEAST